MLYYRNSGTLKYNGIGILKQLLTKGDFICFVKYSIVGAGSALADIIVFYIFTNIMYTNYLESNIFAFLTGAVINYFFSIRWVFRKCLNNLFLGFIFCALIGIIGLFFSSSILFILLDLKIIRLLFPSENMNFLNLVAKMIATFIVLFWNYGARKLIVFK